MNAWLPWIGTLIGVIVGGAILLGGWLLIEGRRYR